MKIYGVEIFTKLGTWHKSVASSFEENILNGAGFIEFPVTTIFSVFFFIHFHVLNNHAVFRKSVCFIWKNVLRTIRITMGLIFKTKSNSWKFTFPVKSAYLHFISPETRGSGTVSWIPVIYVVSKPILHFLIFHDTLNKDFICLHRNSESQFHLYNWIMLSTSARISTLKHAAGRDAAGQ